MIGTNLIKENNNFAEDLAKIKAEGLYKNERTITTPQGVTINTEEHGDALNFCSNNYLGLSNNNEIKEAAKDALEKYGFGMSSVRFICGTQDIHKRLERKISKFFGSDDTILYTSCFDANGGLFETLFGSDDAIISDSLNHASIIDGIRLCKANRFRYKNNDMIDLENKLNLLQIYYFLLSRNDSCQHRKVLLQMQKYLYDHPTLDFFY